ncbi:MAG: transposase [Oscillospiraceae bacterium]|nr:transposase [Oscillospiraceae bacterium]
MTVKGQKYYVYRYEGNLNGMENAVVLLSYPANAFGKEKALRAFINTNAALSNQEILNLYVVRWEIEVYFRNCKTKLAIDKYQIRSVNGIKRFWLISSLAYLIACFESDRYNFSEGYHLLSQTIQREQISFIFDYALNGGDKSALLEAIA